ncbi:MAG: cyclic lactone autoinducer peptide [Thermoanaerobacteraceae bacterium]|nr:cyclic lactone autoinducer peptide [Thermoanaerobacteraceae bacterium]
MFKRAKLTFLSAIATLALFVGFLSIKPASFFLWYQPEIPEHLKHN